MWQNVNFYIVFPFTDENIIILQDGLLIKRVTEADEGIYRCRARVTALGSIEHKDIQVEVYIPPEINVPPQDINGMEKESVTFKCQATGKPAPSYAWVNKDNEPLETSVEYYVDNEKGVLTVLDLKPEHTGTYRCTAKNPAGEVSVEAKLQVLTKPKVEQFLNITVPVEDDTEFRCIVTGDPAPNIVFKKETHEENFEIGYSDDGRIEIKQDTDENGREVAMYVPNAEFVGGVYSVLNVEPVAIKSY